MKLVSYPTNYSSIFADNIYRFTGVDAATPTEILFYANGVRVGARRYVGREVIETSPKALLARVIAPLPKAGEKCEFVRTDNRIVSFQVGYDDEGVKLSPAVKFTASRTPLQPLKIAGPKEQWRTISPGEFDEVALIAPASALLEAFCEVAGVASVPLANLRTAEEGGVWLLTVVADQILAMVGEREEVTLAVRMSGVEVARIHYTIVPAQRGDVRLAWLNEWGSISYHTFHNSDVEQMVTSRNECRTAQGIQLLSLEGWRTLALSSGYLPEGEMEIVGGVVTAPKVWMVEESGFVPCVLASSQAIRGTEFSVELTLRTARAESYW